MYSLVAISAGVSTPSTSMSLARDLATATETALSARGEAGQTELIELRELATDLAHAFTSPGYTSPALERASELVAQADALIVVTPIFKASYSGLFKMFFDTVDNQVLVDKPVLMGATAGTPRHSLALEYAVRPLFSYFRARTVPTGIFAATEDYGTGLATELSNRIARAASELATSLVADSTTDGGLGGSFSRPGQHKNGASVSFADRVARYN